jgi:N-methylhydantoinase B
MKTTRPKTKKTAVSAVAAKRSAAMKKADPVAVELVRNSLVAATEEMKSVLMRTSYNMIIYEALGLHCGFVRPPRPNAVDWLGPAHVHPRHERCGQGQDRHWGLDNIHPGDILLTNDAYITGAHLNHLTFSIPIFHQGEIVAFSTCMAHWQDIGGILNGVTTDIYAEGLQIPLVKYHRQGVLNEEMRELILMNVRRRDRAAGDLEAQLSACRVGAQALWKKCSQRHGESAWQLAIDAIMDHTEAEARTQVAPCLMGSTRPSPSWTTMRWTSTSPCRSGSRSPSAMTK